MYGNIHNVVDIVDSSLLLWWAIVTAWYFSVFCLIGVTIFRDEISEEARYPVYSGLVAVLILSSIISVAIPSRESIYMSGIERILKIKSDDPVITELKNKQIEKYQQKLKEVNK